MSRGDSSIGWRDMNVFRSCASNAQQVKMPNNIMEAHRRIPPVMAGLCVLFAVVVYAPHADPAELRASGSASALGTSWRGDVAGYGGVEIGARFFGLVGPYVSGALGIGSVDDRMLTAISVGAQLWGPWQHGRTLYNIILFTHTFWR